MHSTSNDLKLIKHPFIRCPPRTFKKTPSPITTNTTAKAARPKSSRIHQSRSRRLPVRASCLPFFVLPSGKSSPSPGPELAGRSAACFAYGPLGRVKMGSGGEKSPEIDFPRTRAGRKQPPPLSLSHARAPGASAAAASHAARARSTFCPACTHSATCARPRNPGTIAAAGPCFSRAASSRYGARAASPENVTARRRLALRDSRRG